MRKWTFIAIGLLVAIVGRVSGQDAPTSDNTLTTAEPMISYGDTYVPTNQDYWITADYLFGWIKGANLPSLVTTSPTTVTDPAKAGVLGQSTTETLLQGLVNQEMHSGIRLGFGYVFDQEYGQAIEAGFIYLAGQDSEFSFSSTDNPILALPYTNAKTNTATSTLVAFPGLSTGSINVESASGGFHGANVALSERIWEGDGMRLDALLGYRYAFFSDRIRIGSHIDELFPDPGTATSTLDEFKARNVFHGLDLGARANFAWNNLSLGLLGKVAVGNMNRTVNINGSQVVTVPPGATDSRSSGMYALSSNSGRHNNGGVSLLPELGANLNWQVRSNVALRVGYSALFLNQIARADDQIDFTLNPDLFAPPTAGATPRRPVLREAHDQLWIQTLNLGVDFKF